MRTHISLPAGARNFLRSIYHALYRRALTLRCAYLDRFATPKSGEPVPPALLRFRVSETPDLSVFLTVGEATAHHLANTLASLGLSLEHGATVLDFGCGAGRTLRWLMKLLPEVRFYGTDTDAEAVAWSNAHLTGAEFRVNGAYPPTKYPNGFFDLVYAISVFTHLNLDHQKFWFAELHRILKPGGLLLFTVHGESAWQSLPADKRAQLQREGFLFETSPKLRGILPDWYHTAFHSESGARHLLGESYRMLWYIPAGMGFHDVVIAQRQPYESD